MVHNKLNIRACLIDAAVRSLQVTEEQNCEEEVFPLSVIYLDQVVSVLDISKTCLQLFACACMFVASKFRETNHLSSKILALYTDNSITVDQLLVMPVLALCHICCRNSSFNKLELRRPLRSEYVADFRSRR